MILNTGSFYPVNTNYSIHGMCGYPMAGYCNTNQYFLNKYGCEDCFINQASNLIPENNNEEAPSFWKKFWKNLVN